jgi:hypothetical protein
MSTTFWKSIATKRPSLSAHRRSPACRVPWVDVFRPETSTTRPSNRSSSWSGVVHGEPGGHARAPGERLGRSEHLVEGGGHVPSVHATRRALVRRAERGTGPHHVVLHPQLDRRRQGVGAAEHRAVVEERVRITAGEGRLPEALVQRAARERVEPVGQPLELVGRRGQLLVGRGAAVEPVDDPPERVARAVQLRPAGRGHRAGELVEEVGPRCRAGSGDARCGVAGSVRVRGEVRHGAVVADRTLAVRAHPPSRPTSTSTNTGAWSLGFWPLRALRSMSAQRTRSASDDESSTRSSRIPRCFGKLPAR